MRLPSCASLRWISSREVTASPQKKRRSRQMAFVGISAATIGLLAFSAKLSFALPAHAASGPSCSVQETTYDGWKAEQLANQWVKLEIVPPGH